MRTIIITLALVLAASAARAEVAFDKVFNDSTLRIDYVFAADSLRSHIYVNKQILTPGWHGRRHNLGSLPLGGNGQIDVVDIATGDTIYRHSFSSLFQEWLTTEEAPTAAMAFENTYLVPQPKGKARIDIKLLDNRHNVTARASHIYDPGDVLVRRPKLDNMTPWSYLHQAKDTANCITIAILGEGYTPEEMDRFREHARIAANEILSYDPFKRHADHISFVAVESPSKMSGVSVPRFNDWKDTPFNSHFSTFYSDRYLTSPSVYAMHDALLGIPYEHIIVLANTEEYGGGGIYNSYTLTAAGHPQFRPVVVHEFGHSFGGLADEYFYEQDALNETYPTDVEPWEPNITTLVDFDSKPWKGMLKKGTPVPTPVEKADKWDIGVFEGGGYRFKGVYRPHDQCRMCNNSYPTFCPVCVDAIDRLIRFYIE